MYVHTCNTIYNTCLHTSTLEGNIEDPIISIHLQEHTHTSLSSRTQSRTGSRGLLLFVNYVARESTQEGNPCLMLQRLLNTYLHTGTYYQQQQPVCKAPGVFFLSFFISFLLSFFLSFFFFFFFGEACRLLLLSLNLNSGPDSAECGRTNTRKGSIKIESRRTDPHQKDPLAHHNNDRLRELLRFFLFLFFFFFFFWSAAFIAPTASARLLLLLLLGYIRVNLKVTSIWTCDG